MSTTKASVDLHTGKVRSIKPRANIEMARTVEQAIVISKYVGVYAAAKFLQLHAVPLHVARRALLVQDKRRSTDPQ